MKYMLLIYGDERAWTEESRAQCMAESRELCHELNARGEYIGSSPLHPVATATTVRVRDGRRLVTDGPFAETAEQLGGFYLIDVEDIDKAIAFASRLPPVTKGTVEIRPVFELADLPGGEPIQPGRLKA